MIIRCPECSTGFQLPDERINADGVKLRCSRCSHVFRVRADDEGDPEIYYQDGDNEEETSKESGSSKASNPFPNAGLDLKPKKSSAFGDLSSDDSDSEMSAFESAFDESSEAEALEEEAELKEESEPQSFSPPPAASSPPAAKKPEPEIEESPQEEEEEPEALMGSGGHFGDPEDLVDSSFGQDGAHFDPDKGKVDPGKPAGPPKKKKKGKHPVGAKGAPPTQRKVKKSDTAADPEAAAAKAAPQPAPQPRTWDEEDFEPHKIGGGAGMKVVTFLLLLCLVAMGFVGVVASLNDGFIDFKAFPDMLRVAFADGEYEPRAQWQQTTQPTVVRTHAAPVTVEGVASEYISVGRDGHLLVLKGMIRNNESQSFDGVGLRAMITTPEGRILHQIAGAPGDDTPVGEFRSLRNIDDARDLLSRGTGHVASRDLLPFTLVFDEDLPQTVRNGENYLVKVEVTGVNWDEGEPVAAQD